MKLFRNLRLGKQVYEKMPYIAFLACLAMVYIANAHKGEKMMRQIEVLEKEAKESEWRTMSVKTDLLMQSSQSQMERRVYDDGLKVAVKPPKKLVVN